MLSDIMPMLDETVWQTLAGTRDIFGKTADMGSTAHRARVTHKAVTRILPVSGAPYCHATATLWLIDHPRPVLAGDVFTLGGGEQLAVVDFERRNEAGQSITKVYLK